MRFAPIAAAAFLLAGSAALPAFAADALGEATGTVTLVAKSADVGVGWTWGDGTLRYKHHNYTFSMSGGQIAAVGFSTVTGTGTVYNLHKASDFSGDYAAVDGEATLGDGKGGSVLENKNGVRIKIVLNAKGARLATAAQGVSITLK